MTQLTAAIGPVEIGGPRLVLIAGPCVAESLDLCLEIAEQVSQLCRRLGIGYVFKASFDKANRSSAAGYRGPGLDTGLGYLHTVRSACNVPVLSDIHEAAQADEAAAVLDAVQIPAFLCRQTDLLVAAGKTGKCVNIKKGQFMAPWDMRQAVAKVRSTGNQHVLLTERGSSFGYNRLVVDMTGVPVMKAFAPVVFDATHSTQQPGAMDGEASGGSPRHAPILAAAALAAGADALFIETHPKPELAKSDAATMLPLDRMEALLTQCLAVFQAVRPGHAPRPF
jgi:2-dehydro-3-deoxyphosphooctonate aldolase (KDO 8-P synthase)